MDDYEMVLGHRGFPGRQFDHGMSTDGYVHRPWHLAEELHVTNWASQQMARTIKRRDPTRPAFWFLSYQHPHPPLVPPACNLDMYRDAPLRSPVEGDWAASEAPPFAVASKRVRGAKYDGRQVQEIRRAFYALCTHIDHQLRIVIGTLREECLLDDTIICFVSDHGDMLGDHGMWAKSLFYEKAAKVPMILVGPAGGIRVLARTADDRLVALRDVMPTLLDLAGIQTPDRVDGLSALGEQRRNTFYGEFGEDANATRMLHDGRFKLIYYPVGNAAQLFDHYEDPERGTISPPLCSIGTFSSRSAGA
jgi:arylsulfatase A-like enzyme